MPPPSQASNNQWATIWRRVGTAENGRPIVSPTPEEVECHWEDRLREVAGPDGGSISIDATISGLPPPPWDLPVGSAVAKGKLAGLQGANQTTVRDAMKVETLSRVPDWRGEEFDVEAGLVKGANVIWAQTGT